MKLKFLRQLASLTVLLGLLTTSNFFVFAQDASTGPVDEGGTEITIDEMEERHPKDEKLDETSEDPGASEVVEKEVIIEDAADTEKLVEEFEEEIVDDALIDTEKLEEVFEDPKVEEFLEDGVETKFDETFEEELDAAAGAGEVKIEKEFSKEELNTITINDELKDFKEKQSGLSDADLREKLDVFKQTEKEKLLDLGVSQEKIDKYLELLDKKEDKYIDGVEFENDKKEEFKMPEDPAIFEFNKLSGDVEGIDFEEIIEVEKPFDDLSFIDVALAYDSDYMPVIADLLPDSNEIVLDYEIQTLAKELEGDPIRIYNWVRENVSYTAYYGSKKGAIGCLRELKCNDVDSASLVISLYRASGIPARYKKGIAIMKIETLMNMMGVEDKKSVYGRLELNNVPVFTVNGEADLNGVNLVDADFTNVTQLAVEWTYPEIFYEYDHRGSNVLNEKDAEGAETTQDLRLALVEMRKKQWIPLEVLVSGYNHTQNEIVANTANFDFDSFWFDYFQYQGDLPPLEKYRQDLLDATGKDIFEDDYKSYKTRQVYNVDVLPNKLPYGFGEGTDPNNNVYEIENWSTLPSDRKHFVQIRLLTDDGNNTEILSHRFDGSEINNEFVEIYYDGATETDRDVLEEYGSFEQTPPALIDIQAHIYLADELLDSSSSLNMGEALLLDFTYGIGNTDLHHDQKFSTSGNVEGIFISLGGFQDKYLYDDINDENRRGSILFEGNSAVAREYIRRLISDAKTLDQSLDQQTDLTYARAVVTENRFLNEVDGDPTTFDFKGKTIDASAHVNNISNTNQFNQHEREIRLVWGLQASYLEGDVFKDLTGLDAVSTVKGLQLAYANPNDYNIHIIDSDNEGVIDGLDLSDNTKQNMHADVQNGNTIVTPDRRIQFGNWDGILYASLDEDGSGSYAIGEQTGQNGGYTYEELQNFVQCGNNGCNLSVRVADVGNWAYEWFFSEEAKYIGDRIGPKDKVASVTCVPNHDRYFEIISGADLPPNAPAWVEWRLDYGYPCYIGSNEFGTVGHSYVLANNGMKFFAFDNDTEQELYHYWVSISQAEATITNDVPNFSADFCRFNVVASTYYCYDKFPAEAAYYVPKQPQGVGQLWTDRGEGIGVYGSILSKLDSPSSFDSHVLCPIEGCDNTSKKFGYVVDKLGYPTGLRDDAWKSPFGTDGIYQTFIGGQIYVETDFFNEEFFVPGYIAKEFNKSEYCIDGVCGTGGQLGFPTNDPYLNLFENRLHQDFENGRRIYQHRSENNRISSEVFEQRLNVTRNMLDPRYRDDFIEGIMDSAYELGVYGFFKDVAIDAAIEVILEKTKDHLMKKYPKKALAKIGIRFIPYAGWAYSGYEFIDFVATNAPLLSACNTDPDTLSSIKGYANTGKMPAYFCGKLGFNSISQIIGAKLGNVISSKFGVKTKNAQESKFRVDGLLDQVYEFNNLRYQVYVFEINKRTAFFENIDSMSDNDLNLLFGDVVTLRRVSDNSLTFYNKYAPRSLYSAVTANQTWPDYDPLPYRPNSNVLEINATNGNIDDFVRFHSDFNQLGTWIVKRSDVPYLQNGDIDVDRVRELWNIPQQNQLTAVSKYVPRRGDVLVEGQVNGGADQNVMQYSIKGFEGMSTFDKGTRFTDDADLTSRM